MQSNEVIQTTLSFFLTQLETEFDGDCISYYGPIMTGLDMYVRDAIEDRQSSDEERDHLIVLLHTPGGFIEAAQRLADCFRKHYKTVEFVVPDYAMSAGTVLVMSGDAIHMDYFSVLGPIDPQIEKNGNLVPALGYLERYKELLEKSKSGKLTTAELTILVESFDQAELYAFQQARELSITLLKEWLVRYKFKSWKKTKSRGKAVTRQMKTRRAGQIAKQLSDPRIWHTHGRGISMEVLQKDLKLQIDDFGSNNKKSKNIRQYHKLLVDFHKKMGYAGSVHTSSSFTGI